MNASDEKVLESNNPTPSLCIYTIIIPTPD